AVAMFQKVITWILLGCLAMIIVVGIFNLNYNPFDFSDPELFTNGFTGVADAAVVLVFSTQGYYLIINYSGRAKDPRKDIPWVWKYIPWLLVIVYGGVGMVAGCVLPLEECANQPLTYVVQSFLPTPLVYLFVIGGACFALLSTLNGLYSSYGAVWAEAAKDGWYPKFLSTVNKNGQPVILMTIAAVIAVLPMLLDFSIQTITNNIILLTLFVDIFPCIAAFILPSKYPDAWKNSVVHMKKGAFICLMSVSLIVQIACAYWSARSMSITAVIISLACVAVCFIYGYFRGSKEEVKCPELSKEFLES
ncbi:MAG TPA: amino acid permease, partial [Candidatus Scatomorpha stercorigallinarum]|nr:amino acid permease [Candidatus Scatomorpha stercorigallinarum]